MASQPAKVKLCRAGVASFISCTILGLVVTILRMFLTQTVKQTAGHKPLPFESVIDLSTEQSCCLHNLPFAFFKKYPLSFTAVTAYASFLL